MDFEQCIVCQAIFLCQMLQTEVMEFVSAGTPTETTTYSKEPNSKTFHAIITITGQK
jgi:hypothetical protein